MEVEDEEKLKGRNKAILDLGLGGARAVMDDEGEVLDDDDDSKDGSKRNSKRKTEMKRVSINIDELSKFRPFYDEVQLRMATIRNAIAPPQKDGSTDGLYESKAMREEREGRAKM